MSVVFTEHVDKRQGSGAAVLSEFQTTASHLGSCSCRRWSGDAPPPRDGTSGLQFKIKYDLQHLEHIFIMPECLNCGIQAFLSKRKACAFVQSFNYSINTLQLGEPENIRWVCDCN